MGLETLKDAELDNGLGDTESMMSSMNITDCFCISTDEALGVEGAKAYVFAGSLVLLAGATVNGQLLAI